MASLRPYILPVRYSFVLCFFLSLAGRKRARAFSSSDEDDDSDAFSDNCRVISNGRGISSNSSSSPRTARPPRKCKPPDSALFDVSFLRDGAAADGVAVVRLLLLLLVLVVVPLLLLGRKLYCYGNVCGWVKFVACKVTA